MRNRFLTALALAGTVVAPATGHATEIAAPYVPTAPSVVERMLAIAGVGTDDFIIDLGSGDGRIVIAAARNLGACGFGIEIDPKLVALSNANARAAGPMHEQVLQGNGTCIDCHKGVGHAAP